MSAIIYVRWRRQSTRAAGREVRATTPTSNGVEPRNVGRSRHRLEIAQGITSKAAVRLSSEVATLNTKDEMRDIRSDRRNPLPLPPSPPSSNTMSTRKPGDAPELRVQELSNEQPSPELTGHGHRSASNDWEAAREETLAEIHKRAAHRNKHLRQRLDDVRRRTRHPGE